MKHRITMWQHEDSEPEVVECDRFMHGPLAGSDGCYLSVAYKHINEDGDTEYRLSSIREQPFRFDVEYIDD